MKSALSSGGKRTLASTDNQKASGLKEDISHMEAAA